MSKKKRQEIPPEAQARIVSHIEDRFDQIWRFFGSSQRKDEVMGEEAQLTEKEWRYLYEHTQRRIASVDKELHELMYFRDKLDDFFGNHGMDTP